MIKMNLQFFGGNGSGGGESLGNGGGGSANIVSETDIWSYRHNPNNEPFANEIIEGVRTINDDFPGVMGSAQTVNAAKFGGADDRNTLGMWSSDGNLYINQRYTDVGKMNSIYDVSIRQGYHPSRGDKTGTQAVKVVQKHGLVRFPVMPSRATQNVLQRLLLIIIVTVLRHLARARLLCLS